MYKKVLKRDRKKCIIGLKRQQEEKNLKITTPNIRDLEVV